MNNLCLKLNSNKFSTKKSCLLDANILLFHLSYDALWWIPDVSGTNTKLSNAYIKC